MITANQTWKSAVRCVECGKVRMNSKGRCGNVVITKIKRKSGRIQRRAETCLSWFSVYGLPFDKRFIDGYGG